MIERQRYLSDEIHEETVDRLGDKDVWHSYSLQDLSGSRFVNVVGKILDGEHLLVNPLRGQKRRSS